MIIVIRDNHGVIHQCHAVKPFESLEDDSLLIVIQSTKSVIRPYMVRVLDIDTSEYTGPRYAKTMVEAIRVFNSWYL
jgi:acyl-ACP thioesterase